MNILDQIKNEDASKIILDKSKSMLAVHFARKPVEPVTRMVLSLKHPATLVASMAAMAIDYFYRSMRRCALPCATYSYIYLLPIFVTHQSRRGRGEERFLHHTLRSSNSACEPHMLCFALRTDLTCTQLIRWLVYDRGL